MGIFGKSAKLTKTRSRSISCHIVTLLCFFVVGIISILGENFLILTKRKKKKAKSKYTHDYFLIFDLLLAPLNLFFVTLSQP